MSEPPLGLKAALAALEKVAEAAGLAVDRARAEGEALAAAIAESAPRAHLSWGEETGHQGVQPFFDAASAGRRWRASATTQLEQLSLSRSPHALSYAEALAAVASAASTLGELTPRVLGNAELAAAAQLSAVGRSAEPAMPAPPAQPIAAATLKPAPTETVEPEAKSLEELLAELDALIGLAEVKAEIHRQVAILRVEGLRKEAGLNSPAITRHLIFVGNPGTGKTTVARLVGGIYRALGLLSKGQLIEVDRSELVAGYLGQTAIKTAEVVTSAVGGVLFIDEAYSLAGDQYGQEAIDTLVKEMEDKRDDLVLIVAGYPDPMAVFIGQNPGLLSRFRTTIEFADYSDDELIQIFRSMATAADYDLTDEAMDTFQAMLTATPRGPSFGNGRFARNCLESAIGHHAWRLREVADPTLEQLRSLLPSDLETGLEVDLDTESS